MIWLNPMSKSLLIIMFIFLYHGINAAILGYEVVTNGNKHGLADDAGNIVIPIVYDNLGWSNGTNNLINEVFGYYENGKWGLINTKNKRISAPVYVDLYPANEGFLVASRKNSYSDTLFGILDTKGNARLGFQYHSLSPSGNILIAGQQKDGELKWGVIDYEEREVISIKYDRVEIQHLNFVVYIDGSAAIYSLEGNQLTGFDYDTISELGSYSLVYDGLGKQGLVDNMGNIITPVIYKSIRLNSDSSATLTEFPRWELIIPEKGVVKEFYYDKIAPVSHGIYNVTTNGRQAIINIDEEYLVNGNDWRIMVPDDQFVIVQQDSKYGVLKRGGIEVLPLQFDSIYYSGKHFYVLTTEESSQRWQIYSDFGSLISSSYFDAIFPMSENIIATRKNGYWGYIDFSGHVLIEYKYDYAWPFKNGRAKVNYLGNQGIINTVGEWVVYPNHSEVTIVNTDLFINHTGPGLDLIDANERVVYQTYNHLALHSYGLLEITASNKYGLIDHVGKSIIPPIYDNISELSGNQVYILRKDQRHGVIGKDGKFLLNLTNEYEHIGSLSEGFLSIKKDGRYGFIDFDGKLRIANRYDAVEDFKEGLAAVQLVGKWGFINRLDRLTIQPRYDEVENFDRGVSIVRKDNMYGIIDTEGKEVLPTDYDSLCRNEMNSFVVVKSGKYGLANLKGELQVPPKFALLEENESGYIIVKQRGMYGVIKKNGINVIPTVYEKIIYDQFNGYYLAGKQSQEQIISTK